MYRNNSSLREVKVKDLTPGSKWFTITVKVLRVGDERKVFSRRDGEEHKVAEALVGDETGTVLLSLWDEDIERVKEKIGASVTITNGYVSTFRGSIRLSLGRFGKLEEAKKAVEEVNESYNVSEIKVEERPERPGGRGRRRRFS